MTSSTRRPGARGAATVLTLALLGAGCGGGSDGDAADGGGPGGDRGQAEAPEAGVTAETVTIGGHFPLTGPAAPGRSGIALGHTCYYEHVNDDGGVHGRRIEWISRDDAGDPTQATQVVNQLVLEDGVFAVVGGVGTEVHSAVLDPLNSEGVPDLFVSAGSLRWDDPATNPYTFGWQPDHVTEGKIVGEYVAEELPEARVGLLLQGDEVGEDGAAGLRGTAASSQVVAEAVYAPGATDLTAQVQELQAAGADLVLGFSTPTYTALGRLAALELGYSPRWFHSNAGSEQRLVGDLLQELSEGRSGDDTPLDGALTTEYLPAAADTDDPWVQLFTAVWDDCEGRPAADEELSSSHVHGMAQAYTVVQALQAAGREPTRDGVVEAIESAGAGFEGPAHAPFRYSADSHLGISGMKVVRLTAGAPEDLTPVLVTDPGDGPVEELDEEPSGPPEDGIPDVQPVR